MRSKRSLILKKVEISALAHPDSFKIVFRSIKVLIIMTQYAGYQLFICLNLLLLDFW